MSFIVRKPKLSDAEQLGRLYLEFWEPHQNVDPLLKFTKRLSLKDQVNSARMNLRKKNNRILVAEENNKLVGFIELFIKKNEDCFKIQKYGYLNAAATRKDFRGRGIAKALTNEAFKYLKKKGIVYVKTNVYNTNILAKKTWKKMGFQPQSTIFIAKLR